MMLAGMREAVWETCAGVGPIPFGSTILTPALYPEVPGDLAGLPAIVVGMPSAAPRGEGRLFDVDVDVYVITHPEETPGRDTSLLVVADAVVAALGGTAGLTVVTAGGDEWRIRVEDVDPANVTIAEITDYPAYTITVGSAYQTC